MILSTLAAACSSPQFTQEWLVDRTRVLAVRAEPPEAAPGATVTLSALVVDPDGDPEVAWIGCAFPVDCPDYAAVQDLAAADTSTMTADELAAWQADSAAVGFLGFGVGLSPTLLVSGGGSATVVLDAVPAGKALGDVTLGDPEATEIATKSVTVSDSEAPNQNPGVESLSVDGESVATVSPGEVVSLTTTLTDGSAEGYVDEDGETQTEAPSVSYYVSDGTLMPSSATADDSEVSWTAPDAAGAVDVWVVVRDGRGGIGWDGAHITVENGGSR